jgi:hypothetical protein
MSELFFEDAITGRKWLAILCFIIMVVSSLRIDLPIPVITIFSS